MDQPQVLGLYVAFLARVLAAYPDTTRTVMKTAVALAGGFRFAYAGAPLHRMKGWPKACLVVTLMHDTRLESPHVVRAVEPYPNRWTHHIMLADADAMDGDLMRLVAMSYEFAHRKGRRGRGKG